MTGDVTRAVTVALLSSSTQRGRLGQIERHVAEADEDHLQGQPGHHLRRLAVAALPLGTGKFGAVRAATSPKGCSCAGAGADVVLPARVLAVLARGRGAPP